MKHKIFLDSGAFSAYQNKTSINIEDYIRFINDHLSEIETYANLDSIGSAEESWKNQKIMEDAGLNPLPVYHLDEDPRYLEMCMEYPYFCVGGLASAKGKALAPFLRNVFKKICTKKTDYFPSHKIHGFGIATPQIINMFPWYSIDTTSWVQYGRYGIILIPQVLNQQLLFNKPPMTITVSTRSKAFGDSNYFWNLPKESQEWITKYCYQKGFAIGLTEYKYVEPKYKLKENEKFTDRKKKDKVEVVLIPGLCNDGDMRTAFNLEFFLDLEKNQLQWPWRWLPDNDRTIEDILNGLGD